MKKDIKTLIIFICICMPVLCLSQTHKKHLLSPELNQKTKSLKVTNQDGETILKEKKISDFMLGVNEKKAVVQTGSVINEVDSSILTDIRNFEPSRKVYMLPELYFAKEAGSNKQIKFRILVYEASPLQFNFIREEFRGMISFLPVEISKSGNSQTTQKQLSVPEEIVISYGRQRNSIKISSINWPPVNFNFNVKSPLDSIELRLLTISKPLGYSKNIKVEPAIVLSSPRKVFQGLGIQTLPIYVSLKGISNCEPVHFAVATTLGIIDEANVTLNNDRPHEVHLRSEGLGKFQVSVISSNLISNKIDLESVFPWFFLILSIFGGLIGSIAKSLFRNKKLTLKPLILGSIFGLIVAIAYWGLGVNLLGIQIKVTGLTEVMVFGMGLLAGYAGIRIPE